MELKSLVGALSTERLTGYRRTGRSEAAEHILASFKFRVGNASFLAADAS